MRKFLALMLVFVMVFSLTVPAMSTFAETTQGVGFYNLVAEDVLYNVAYGFASGANVFIDKDAPFDQGEGWESKWVASSPSATKLDLDGAFIGRPTATVPVRISRNFAEKVDFSYEGTYTFTTVLRESNAVQTQDFRFELGNSGIEFGFVVPVASSYFYPQLKLPNGDMTIYSGAVNDSHVQVKGKTITVVLEVTTVKDGVDTLKVKTYTEGKTSDWLMTQTAEISDKVVEGVKVGFNYSASYANTNGVSRIRNVKVEALTKENPHAAPVMIYNRVSDSLTREGYGVSGGEAFIKDMTEEALNKGTGWNGIWTSVNPSVTKFDGHGMFIGRPTAAIPARIKRNFAKPVVFSANGTYTFTAEVIDSTLQTQDFRFELGNTGIEFGAVVPEAKGHFLPQLKLPNQDMIIYDGEVSDSLLQNQTNSTFIVLEITTDDDGVDTFKVKAYQNGKTSDWLITQTAEISDKKADFANVGYNYCPNYANTNGVSRIKSIDIETYTDEFAFTNTYEDFESYVAQGTLTDNKGSVKLADVSPVNGGTGWGGPWQDSASTQIMSADHSFKLKEKHFTGSKDDYKLFKDNIEFYTTKLGEYPIKRKFVNKMEFSKAGEYYVKVNARAAVYNTSGNIPNHKLAVTVGDITFGTTYVEGKTTIGSVASGGNPYFYPYLTVGDQTITGDVGVHTGQHYDYVAKIVSDGKGNTDVSFTVDGENYLKLKGTSLSSSDYIYIGGKNGPMSVDLVQVEGCSAKELDTARDAIKAYANGTGTREDAVASIEKIGGVFQTELKDELAYTDGKLIVSDDFESYADATDTELFKTWDVTVKFADIDPINGGLGWKGAWRDSTTDQIVSNHRLIRTQENGSGLGTEKALDLYVSEHGAKPLTRNFAVPIDFTEKGEYFVKVTSQPSLVYNSGNFKNYDIKFSLGDDIHFGSGYDAERSDNSSATSNHFYPFLYVGDEKYESDNALITARYYDYIVNIISNGDGSGKVRFKIYHRNTAVPNAYEKEIEFTNMSPISKFTVGARRTGAVATVRISDITIERYTNDEKVSAARKALDDLAVGKTTYKAAKEVVNQVSGIAKTQMLAELEDNSGYLKIENGTFADAAGVPLMDASKVEDSVLYTFDLYNNYKVEKTANVFLGVYYDGYLAGVKMLNKTLPAKSRTETPITLGFEKLPAGEREKVTVKAFVFDDVSNAPLSEKISMYSAADMTVTPEIFGKDAEGKTIVAFMGDSITHLNPSYAKWLEYYYRIKYPTKDIKFVNKGISGDSAAGNEARFYWDILNDPNTGRPTEACIMIGMNDVNRRLYPDTGTEEAKQNAINTCLTNIADIADLCEKEGIKLTLVTPPIYDEAAYTSAENNVGVNAALSKIAESVIRLANERGLAYIDFNGYLNEYNNRLRSMEAFRTAQLFNVSDRIHATPVGTFAAGFVFINKMFNNVAIASTDIDVNSLDVVTDSADVTNVTYAEDVLSYTYAPKSLPMYMTTEYETFEKTYGFQVTNSINREIIKVAGLTEGNYKIMIGDAEIGTYSSADLAKGVNIATAPTNPGYIQSKSVYDLVTTKMGHDNLLRSIAYVERNLANKVDLKDVDACIAYLKANYPGTMETDARYGAYETNKRSQAAAVSQIATIENQLMTVAKPGVYEVKIIKQ